MILCSSRSRPTKLRTILLSTLSLFLAVTAAKAYEPESPEVQAMIKRAAAFLHRGEGGSHGVGGQALVGMALHKADPDGAQAQIKMAIDAARDYGKDLKATVTDGNSYNAATCCMLLVDADPDGSRSQIQNLIKGMLQRQRPSGSWTYNAQSYDDLSQTQYGLLCLWAGYQIGMEIPVEAVERSALWLVRSQHADGGWSYRPLQNIDPTPINDSRHILVTHSMTAAGAGSLYVCAHLLGFSGQPQPKSELPPALVKVEKEGKALRPRTTTPETLSPAVNRANGWFAKNLNFETKWWTHYYMYGLERYKSFQELVEKNPDKEPAWYNQGVEFLQKTQNSDGSWKSLDAPISSPVIDTALAVLFLGRSSQRMIQKMAISEGRLIGGHGLPKDLTNARLQDGQVVTPQMVRDVDDLMELLKGTEDKEFDALALPGGLSLDQDLTKRTSQLERLRSLVTNADFNARLAAVKTLARSRELDNVPALIYALSDIDPRIVDEADRGLRFISRKFRGVGLPDDPTEEQKQAAEAKWKEWFLSIRPDAVFLD